MRDLDTFETFARMVIRILTKDSKLIPFRLNKPQLKLVAIRDALKAQGKPVRIIVLKARQLGFSTLIDGLIYKETAMNFYTNSMIIAHDDVSTNKLFTALKRMYDLSPEHAKPLMRYSNAKELIFENPDSKTRDAHPGLMSGVIVQKAGSRDPGRGQTVQKLHISELAFWKNAKKILVGLMQMVPSTPESEVYVESTANGVAGDGEAFYDWWNDAKSGKSDYYPLFIPWFDGDEYRMPIPLDFVMTDKEAELQDLYRLDFEQIYWRRWKIANDFRGDETAFRQEYPSTAEEAFVLSGRPVFDLGKVQSRMARMEPNHPRIDGDWIHYEEPIPGKIYILGGDVAEGLAEGDYSTAFVMDKSMKQVARFKGHLDPDLFGIELDRVGRFYNDALVCPEANNHGHMVISKLKQREYPNIFEREIYDEIVDKKLKKLGWLTTSISKRDLIDGFIECFREDAIGIRDEELYKEMLKLSYEPDGSVILNSRDLFVSACIAIQALRQAPEDFLFQARVPDSAPPRETFQQRMERLGRKKDPYYFH